jgi:chitinase
LRRRPRRVLSYSLRTLLYFTNGALHWNAAIMNCWSFLGLTALASAITYSQAEYRRVCYVANWAQYRPQPGTFFPNQTDPSLCSHIMFAYAIFDVDSTIKPSEWNDDIPGGLYEQTIALKQLEPGLKVSISVGGWDIGMYPVSVMLSTPENRKTFIDSVIPFCRQRDFDGVDLDFQFPGSRGSSPEDKYHFTDLLQEFRIAIDNEAATTGRAPLLLTAAVGAIQTIIDAGYEVPEISQYVDFLEVRTFDFNGPWDTIAGLHAALYPRADEFGEYFGEIERSTLNLDWAARYWVELGAPKEKLVLGLAFFGRGATLVDPRQYDPGAPINGPSDIEPFTREVGFKSYYEICLKRNEYGGSAWHVEQESCYAWRDVDQYVSYDNDNTHETKVEYIVDNCFSGWMAWSIDLDDFSGNLGCERGPYPLLQRASDALKNRPEPASCRTTASTPASTATTPTTTTTTTTTTAPPTATTTATPFTCDGKSDGYYSNPGDCTSFIVCTDEVKTVMECAEGLYYDDINQTCNWSYNLSEERQEECGLA